MEFILFLLITCCVYKLYKFVRYCLNEKKYNKSDYFKCTKLPYSKLKKLDTGKWGEYLIYSNLESLVSDGARFLFNVYVPTEKGYSEIDCIMLYKKGIFVFESKNYSGWIFGNDSCRNWTQSLYSKYDGVIKDHFLNPVWQNDAHICALKTFLGEEHKFYSVITFSDRCKFKTVVVNTPNVYLIHREDVLKIVNNIVDEVLSSENISSLYDKLFPLTQVTDEIKSKHISNIKKG